MSGFAASIQKTAGIPKQPSDWQSAKENEPRINAKLDESRLVMIRVLPLIRGSWSLNTQYPNYTITNSPLIRVHSRNSQLTQGWFQLLCFRLGCRRVLRTEASGFAAVNPACAKAAAVHGRAACRPASTGKAGGRFQLPGGNGSRQQNGRQWLQTMWFCLSF